VAERYVALVRGINVGTSKRVAMADLRAIVTRLGHSDVRTLLNSGNVVFTATRSAPDVGRRIERAMLESIGIAARVFALTAAEVSTIMKQNTLGDVANNPSRLLVAVTERPEDLKRMAPLRRSAWHPEALAVGRRAAYLWLPAGSIDSALAKGVARLLGDSVTTRNWATMMKLHALLT
jgi:uncharacterized protein (DUF1697 family)